MSPRASRQVLPASAFRHVGKGRLFWLFLLAAQGREPKTSALLAAISVSLPWWRIDIVGRVGTAIAFAAHLELTGFATTSRPAIICQPPFGPLLEREQERDAALRCTMFMLPVGGSESPLQLCWVWSRHFFIPLWRITKALLMHSYPQSCGHGGSRAANSQSKTAAPSWS